MKTAKVKKLTKFVATTSLACTLFLGAGVSSAYAATSWSFNIEKPSGSGDGGGWNIPVPPIKTWHTECSTSYPKIKFTIKTDSGKGTFLLNEHKSSDTHKQVDKGNFGSDTGTVSTVVKASSGNKYKLLLLSTEGSSGTVTCEGVK
ncbi:hypothetical protein [Thermoactinomyces sp. DSM 45892]|uniref:hypothetical protein n=1 Tax=Thermoactinomyces sp. DSM 45892 TaxID=1882753 RepID=UPI00089739B7|nr:hypothetical protein [Thermoactinomyces sp. DSM 45892]SDZ20024.1 hypothetical protein SAMN05444416_1163 [Thermoactinomyces sp. DSM 45892]